jgi:two-component system sensor histidine kinase VanS
MRFSIRRQLFVAILILITMFISLSLVMNNLFMRVWYTHGNKRRLVNLSESISGMTGGSDIDLTFELQRIDRTEGVHIVLFTGNLETIYESRPTGMRDPDNLDRPPRFDHHGIDRRPTDSRAGKQLDSTGTRRHLKRRVAGQMDDLQVGEYSTFTDRHHLFGNSILSILRRTGEDTWLIITMPLESIDRNVAFANRFFLLTGLLILFAGVIVAMILSRLFTGPIVRINEIARAMSRLDFSHRYTGHRRDEIGELGESINSMSSQLAGAIERLQVSNRQLLKDIEREKEIDRVRREFISSVSHELKTPISLLQGYAEGLKDNIDDSPGSREYYLDVIIDEASRMDRLINDLLDLSRIDRGEYHLEMSRVDPVELVSGLLKKYGPRFSESSISVSFESKARVIITADRLRLEQVFSNFLNNALRHVEHGGRITASVSVQDGRVRLSLFNSGKAIPESELDAIWNSFYKVDKARTRGSSGTGLGLAIARAITELHSGSCGAENIDDGVLFWVELPVAE